MDEVINIYKAIGVFASSLAITTIQMAFIHMVMWRVATRDRFKDFRFSMMSAQILVYGTCVFSISPFLDISTLMRAATTSNYLTAHTFDVVLSFVAFVFLPGLIGFCLGKRSLSGPPPPYDDAMTFFNIERDVSADDQSADARLLGIQIFFTTSAATDA